MRTLFLTALAAVALTACQPKQTNREALIENCTSKGERPTTCVCVVDAMAAKLSPDLFSRSAHAIAREKRDIVGYIRDLPEDHQIQYAAALDDMFACQLATPPEAEDVEGAQPAE